MRDATKLDTKKRGETLCTQINIPIVVALKSFKSLIKEAKWVATSQVIQIEHQKKRLERKMRFQYLKKDIFADTPFDTISNTTSSSHRTHFC